MAVLLPFSVLLCLCIVGATANNPPPPGVSAFVGGEGGYSWYFYPQLVVVNASTLVAISEAHKECKTVGDRGWIDLVVRRSLDEGRTWSPVQLVATGRSTSSWVGNPAPFVDKDTGESCRPKPQP